MQLPTTETRWRIVGSSLLVALCLALAALYWDGAMRQLTRVNTDSGWTDQSAYMNYAREMVQSNYSFVGGRNRMPVYPFIQSLFYEEGMSEKAFFNTGKRVNLVLSIFLLAGVGAIFRRFFPKLETLTLVSITAFTVFIFKAGFFQTELLFYFANFCLFVLMLRLLQAPSWSLSLLAGIVAGVAHLTKASVLPGLAIFLAFATVKALWSSLRPGSSDDSSLPKRLFANLFPTMLVALFFLVTVYPYIATSKRVFGHYFYNVNSTFYMWYDSWNEAKRGTRAHGDRLGWPDMPPEKIPSMTKYLREHSAKRIYHRLVVGKRNVLKGIRKSYGYDRYILLYACLLLAGLVLSRRVALQSLRADPLLYMFLLTYFSAYFVLCAWYAVIVGGNRIILANFLPLLFVLAYGSYRLLRPLSVRIGGRVLSLSTVATAVILAILALDAYDVLTKRVGVMYGGF